MSDWQCTNNFCVATNPADRDTCGWCGHPKPPQSEPVKTFIDDTETEKQEARE